jgi:hypothetical protein
MRTDAPEPLIDMWLEEMSESLSCFVPTAMKAKKAIFF